MIKLGVFDLDGTLLTGEDKLPETFYSDVELLARRGVSVAMVSARPARFLFEMFDRETDLLISGEDGNIFFRGKELLHARFVSSELIRQIGSMIQQHEDLAVLYSGLEELYVSEEHYRRFLKWGFKRFMPDHPRDLSGDEKICKIHVLCRGGVDPAKRLIASDFREISRSFDVTESGYGWIGIMEKDSNKASAVRFFQQYLKIGNDETAVFGDSSNDVPMFALTKYSFAMKNAPSDIQRQAANITREDNDHNGAMKALIELSDRDRAGL